MRKKLTELSIARLAAPERGYDWYPDSLLPAFGLRVYPTGNRVWGITRRWDGAKHPTFRPHGKWPEVGLAEARKRARAILSDPDGHTRRRRDTVAAVAGEWLKRDQAGNRCIAEVTRIIRKDLLPALGDRPITDIKKRDIIGLIDAIADRGSPIMANRTLGHVRRLFRWAASRDIIDADPAPFVLKPALEVRRDRVLDAGELRAVWQACEADWYPFGVGIRLLILTLARRSEIFDLRRDEIDREQHSIRLPGARAKAGEARIVPLSEAALEIIDVLPDLGGPLVLSTNGRGRYQGFENAKTRLDRRIREQRGGPLSPWRIHDLRRTGATGLQRLGIRLEVIETVLGHVSGTRSGVVGTYQRHRFEREAAEALEAWGREVERIVTGAVARVVALRR